MTGPLVVAALAVLGCSTAHAQTQVYRLLVPWSGFKAEQIPGDAPNDTIYTAARFTHFRIVEEKGEDLVIRVSWVPEAARAGKQFTMEGVLGVLDTGKPKTFVVPNSRNYVIAKKDLPTYNYDLFSGLDFGTVALPYKLQMSDHSLTAGATVGGFVGLRQRWLVAPTTMLVSAGLSGIPTTDVNATNVDTKLGLTLASGVVFPITTTFQIGLLIGMDHLGGDAGDHYPYNDKGWLTLSIGYAFTQ